MRRKVLIVLAIVVAIAVVACALMPLMIATTIKLWVRRAASEHALTIDYGKLQAPFLRSVVIENVRVTEAPHNVLTAERVEIDLDLAALFNLAQRRVVKHLRITGLRGEMFHPENAARSSAETWRAFGELIADRFEIAASQFTVRYGDIALDFQNCSLTASELEAGRFEAANLTFSAPLMRKSFTTLRGATKWQDTRLTIAGVTLMRGLDVHVLTFDLSRLDEQRITTQAEVDAFGGKLRLSVTSETNDAERSWDIAGSATEVSLGRISDALDFSTRASGSLHASKFTFRGNPARASAATASIWAEATGFTWRDRTADTVMLGATLYEHQVSVEQLYIKQRRNQLTLSGEIALPSAPNEWPDFRGDVSGAIGDLGDFARLVGGRAADFAGQLTINGAISQSGKELAGQISAAGKSVTLFGAPLDSIECLIVLDHSTTRVDRLQLQRNLGDSNTTLTLHGAVAAEANKNACLQLTSDQKFSASAASECIDRIELAPPHDPQLFDKIEIRRDAKQALWTIDLTSKSDHNAAHRIYTTCGGEITGQTLQLAPAAP